MSSINRGPLGSAFLINRDPANANGHSTANSGGGPAPAYAIEPQNASKPAASSASAAIPISGPAFASQVSDGPMMTASSTAVLAPPGAVPVPPPRGALVTTDLVRSLAEVKGQAQFLLYLADQIEDSLHQLIEEHDDCQNAFLCRILSMYSTQLETKHHGLGDKIAETCQEVYVTVREYDAT